jgi:hypothetical protein
MSGVEFPARWPECTPEASFSEEEERENRRKYDTCKCEKSGNPQTRRTCEHKGTEKRNCTVAKMQKGLDDFRAI